MGKKDKELDKSASKRLSALEKQWNEEGKFGYFDGITAADLRLLLEDFAPLQDLIRDIVATPTGHIPTAMTAVDNTERQEALREAQAEAARLRDENARLQNALATAQEEGRDCERQRANLTAAQRTLLDELEALKDRERQSERRLESSQTENARLQSQLATAQEESRDAQRDLAECVQKAKGLLGQKEKLDAEKNRLETTVRQLQREVEQAQSRFTSPQLAFIRREPELAARLYLENLPADDSAALVQVVAVLSQKDNLQRLWEGLKERCEAQGRSATDEETDLLRTALQWYNYNWRTLPFQPIEAGPGSAYAYERHQRSRDCISGETVREMRLLGIADGSGKPLCKALVMTS
jgi:myosin heavy subunit